MPAKQRTRALSKNAKNLEITHGKCWCCFLEAREESPIYQTWVNSNGTRNWNKLKQINLSVRDRLPVRKVAFYNYDTGWGYCERHIKQALKEI